MKKGVSVVKNWVGMHPKLALGLLFVLLILFAKKLAVVYVLALIGMIAYLIGYLIKNHKALTAKEAKLEPKIKYLMLGIIALLVAMIVGAGSSQGGANLETKKDTASEPVKDQKQVQLAALNKWYKNEHVEYMEGSSELWKNALIEFNVSGGYLLASVSMPEMDKNDIEKRDIGAYAFANVLPQYEGDLSAFDNLDGNTLKPEKMLKSEMYVEYYVK